MSPCHPLAPYAASRSRHAASRCRKRRQAGGGPECRASRWVSDATALARLMTAVECRGGYTQIRKVLKHALREASAAKVSALVYVGDAMEEAPDELCNRYLPVRAGGGGPASRAAGGGGGLRGRWTGGTSRLCKRPRRPYFAARTDV